MKLFGRAVHAFTAVASFALLLHRLKDGAADITGQKEVVTCKETNITMPVSITKANSTVQVTCPASYSFLPALEEKKVENVYSNDSCTPTKKLDEACTGATGAQSEQGATITINELPATEAVFFLLCQSANQQTKCKVQVTVKKPSPTVQSQPAGGGVGANVCDAEGKSITISLPNKDSSVQFSCGSAFKLYPLAENKVFSEDCKHEEDLKDITRTASVSGYTLKATKKPPKKKLCYLCAKTNISPPGQASDYCVVYVQSSSRRQYGSGFTLILILSYLPALLRFT